MTVTYAGKDLEAMTFAVNYHRWILDSFRPFLGKRLVEVGAGSGSFSEMLWQGRPERLVLVEPSGMYDALRQKFQGTASVNLFKATFAEVAGQIRQQCSPDSIIYVNVLEHIRDDEGELRGVFGTLEKGGHILLFVPALQCLMGPLDRAIGHFRRYQKRELERKCERAGFRIVLSRYFDAPGILPWWLKYRVLGSDSLEGGSVRLYDRLCVPFIRRMESLVTPPIGKNILLIGRKP